MPSTVDRLIGDAARQELARRRLVDYGSLMLPDFERPRHVEALCEHLERLERGEIRRLAVCLPPRSGKSTLAAQLLPAWHLGRNPTHQVVVASYGAELATMHSRRARALLADPRSPFDVAVSDESRAADRWSTTAGGTTRAAGVLGGLTGHGANLLVIDDAVKDREAADSEAVQEATWRWYSEVALTRLMPGGRVLVCGTRWHEQDLLGRLLDGPGAAEWTTLVLPALAEENDPLGREPGEALWPAWYDADYLHALRVELGERSFRALYQQQPTSDEGGLFKRAWLAGTYETLPEQGLRIVTACDASFGKTGGDFSALVTIASDDRSYLVIDARRGRWTFAELLAQIERVADEFNPEAVVIEDAAAGQSALQELRRSSDVPIVPVKAAGAKIVRAEGVSALLEGGRVMFPAADPAWKGELVEELASFPTGRFDDLVDAFVYALRRLRERENHGAGGAVLVRHPAIGDRVERPFVDPRGEAVPADAQPARRPVRQPATRVKGTCRFCGVSNSEEPGRIGAGADVCMSCMRPANRPRVAA